MKAEELDAKFDAGESVLEYFDLSTAKRGDMVTQVLPIDLPVWMWELLEQEAQRLGVERQSLVKTWIAQQLVKSSVDG
ncbi:MAG: CopG family transcriptional regulator [Oscillatoriales cyanobacterium SM2_2_1]|nr:CopG family transcriptional regulator [Oscillatoriales cyanobacterium SM2_2_1]